MSETMFVSLKCKKKPYWAPKRSEGLRLPPSFLQKHSRWVAGLGNTQGFTVPQRGSSTLTSAPSTCSMQCFESGCARSDLASTESGFQ